MMKIWRPQFTLVCLLGTLAFTTSGCATLTGAVLGAVVCKSQSCLNSMVEVGATMDKVALHAATIPFRMQPHVHVNVDANRRSGSTTPPPQPQRPENQYYCVAGTSEYDVQAESLGAAISGCSEAVGITCSCN